MVTLVTGATGFLGSRLARRLVERGEPVRALVRATSDLRRLDGVPVEFAEGDVTERGSVDRAMQGASRVYHCAALYELGTKDRARMERINVAGTANVLGAAAERALPTVYVSSVVAYGPTGPAPADESHWSASPPRSAYEATKRAAHLVARRLVREGAKLRLAVPVTIYGPDDPSLVGWAHRLFTRGLLRVGAFADVHMSMVHVDDCADGLARIADAGEDGEEYILSERSLTFREWFDAFARASGKPGPALYLPDWMLDAARPATERGAELIGFSRELVREGFAMSKGIDWAFEAGKARRALGWRPRGIDEGLAEVARFYRDDERRRS